MSLIQVKNLSKTYESGGIGTKAVRGATFSVEKGEFLAIMGPSGSGKSTLMHMLGFLDRPTAGEYLLSGRDTSKFSDDELADMRNKKIGFIFQSFNLLPRTSVFENVELPLLYGGEGGKREKDERKVRKALESVKMEHRVGYLSNQLSGGEKQRVAIARALVNKPEIIFADEPTGNLDSKSGIQVMEILDELNDAGHTIILVTHETQTAQYAKRILMMHDGQIVSDRKVEERKRLKDGEILK